MTDFDRVQRIKNIAAQKAFEAYGTTLTKMLEEAGIELLSSVDGTSHIHSAIFFDGDKAVAVRCRWDFTANPEVIAAEVKAAKKEGSA